MGRTNEIKRKHARFPAFSDEQGVKLHSEKAHGTFSKQKNWILTEMEEEPAGKKILPKVERTRHSLRRGIKAEDPQQQELNYHRDHLPDYSQAKTGKASGKSSLQKEYSGHSYFVPKYIPASMIPDEKKERISDKELFRSMRKKQEDYLVFDTQTASFQNKQEENSSLHKFR